MWSTMYKRASPGPMYPVYNTCTCNETTLCMLTMKKPQDQHLLPPYKTVAYLLSHPSVYYPSKNVTWMQASFQNEHNRPTKNDQTTPPECTCTCQKYVAPCMRLDHSPALPHTNIISILKNLCTNHMGAIGKKKNSYNRLARCAGRRWVV